MEGFAKIKGGVTAPQGFEAAALSCRIKESAGDKKDLCLIRSVDSAGKTSSAAVFTTNRVKAAPVHVSHNHLRGGDIRAIIANSGNANACTGVAGIEAAKAMAQEAASHLGLRRRQVLVGSTGIIGVPLPEEKIIPQIKTLVSKLSSKGSKAAAEAIMTSDTKPKSTAVSLSHGGRGSKEIRLGAIGKGAGMICPNMATMLCFVTTDAKVSQGLLKEMVHTAVEQSFNRITVDGDMSTNDTVMVIANGASKTPSLRKGSKEAKLFQEALSYLMRGIAKKIVRDGERVTKFVEVQVKGAASRNDARKVAEAVANSTLVKCSWNGNDPNWGRIIHAVGYSGARMREELIDIYFEGKVATRNGLASDTPISQLQRAVEKNEFTVTIDLNQGQADYLVYSSDFSPEYVDFNRHEYVVARQKKGIRQLS